MSSPTNRPLPEWTITAVNNTGTTGRSAVSALPAPVIYPCPSPLKIAVSSSSKTSNPAATLPTPVIYSCPNIKIALSTPSPTVKSAVFNPQTPIQSVESTPSSPVIKYNSRPVTIINASQLSKQLSEGKSLRINIKKVPPPQPKSCVIIQKTPGPVIMANEGIPKLPIASRTGQQKSVFKVVNVSQAPGPVLNLAGRSTVVLTKPTTNIGTTIRPGSRVITIKRPVTIKMPPHFIRAQPKTANTVDLRPDTGNLTLSNGFSDIGSNSQLVKQGNNEEVLSVTPTTKEMSDVGQKRPHDDESDETNQEKFMKLG
ncbi:uncharacterized protein LOC124372672 [Homalodisca vitripennis]|uniref:uncharacterized protein LOC124372672 n=1 Tax=Homalodisca vitripennis TaxID=197043 RepID=UPI001EEB4B41|nr:uncharacterized protein LOC124372672 [Homalodisca vitripennis]